MCGAKCKSLWVQDPSPTPEMDQWKSQWILAEKMFRSTAAGGK